MNKQIFPEDVEIRKYCLDRAIQCQITAPSEAVIAARKFEDYLYSGEYEATLCISQSSLKRMQTIQDAASMEEERLNLIFPKEE